MPRKPNYAFERKQRAQAKTAKREAKRQARLAAKAENKQDPAETEPGDPAGNTAEE